MKYPIELFQRIDRLEDGIDKKTVKSELHFESLRIYLDALNELIVDYNNEPDNYTANKLIQFLRIRKLRLESVRNIDIYGAEEIEYIEKFNRYIKEVRPSFVGKSYGKSELIYHLHEIVKYELENGLHDEEKLKDAILRNLCEFKTLVYSVHIESKNIYINILTYDYVVCIVNNCTGYAPVGRKFMASLIVNDPEHPLPLEKIKGQNNINLISFKNKRGFYETVDTFNPLDWCILKIDEIAEIIIKSNQISNKEKLLTEIRYLRKRVSKILVAQPFHIPKHEAGYIDEIKSIRIKLINVEDLIECEILYTKENNLLKAISSIVTFLYAMHNRITQRLDIENNIYFSLAEIKRNNTLYILSKNNKKNIDNAYGEENLTSILSSNLRCLYKYHKNISIHCEALVGNGRSDVKITQGNETIAIIESKLIKSGSSVEQETRNAIDQIFARYSENDSVIGNQETELYLVLFAYDKNFRAMAKSIKSAVYTYSERNNLKYEKINMTENGLHFLYREIRDDFGFYDKTRTIKIIVCNMEIDYKTKGNQRARGKEFSINE